jgi:hypothetical protein
VADSLPYKAVFAGKEVLMEINSIFQHIHQAYIEAQKRNIKANAVVISDKLYFSRLLGDGVDVPMVCGLKCIYSDDLPDDTLFAVFEGHNLPLTKGEKIRELEEENKTLRETLDRIRAFALRIANADEKFLADLEAERW